jgi:hypothetical protein
MGFNIAAQLWYEFLPRKHRYLAKLTEILLYSQVRGFVIFFYVVLCESLFRLELESYTATALISISAFALYVLEETVGNP